MFHAFLQCPCIAYFPVLPDREKGEYRSERAIFLEKYAWLFTDICTSLKCSPTTECLGKLCFLLCVGDAKSAWRTCKELGDARHRGPSWFSTASSCRDITLERLRSDSIEGYAVSSWARCQVTSLNFCLWLRAPSLSNYVPHWFLNDSGESHAVTYGG